MSKWIEAPQGSGPTGLGETPVSVGSTWWVKRGDITYGFGAGFGDLATAEAAAGVLMTKFSSAPPSRAVVGEVSAFQSAYNGSGLPGSLTVDGQYGPNTQAALQAVLNQSVVDGPPQAAPQNVFSTSVPSTPEPDVGPVGPVSPTQPTAPITPAGATGIPTPVIVGGAAVLGAGLIYWAWKRKHRR
jgi:hypothetical protein